MIGAAFVAAVLVLVVPAALFAHAHLRRSEPAAHERLASSPPAIRLWFSERPELGFTHIRLRGEDSIEIPLGAVSRISSDPLGVFVPMTTSLKPGTYSVLWQTAAADGHATHGSFSFEVGASASAPVAMHDSTAAHGANALVRVDSTAEESTGLNVSAATRWLEFVAMLAVVGAVVFRLVVLRLTSRTPVGTLPGETRAEIVDAVRRLAQSALVLLLIAAISRFFAEANAVLGPEGHIDRGALEGLLTTSWGVGWLVGVIGVFVCAAGFAIARRAADDTGWFVAALGALAIVIAPALTGHANTTSPVPVSLALDVLHVLAASAWIGGLLALLFAAIPFVRGARAMNTLASGQMVAALVRAFHPVALTCGAIVIATGLCASWIRLPAVSALWESAYGRVLLVKLAFVALVVVLGAMNWRRVMPKLGDEGSARRITRTAGAELTIAAVVLAVTAVLVSTSPPERPQPRATASLTR